MLQELSTNVPHKTHEAKASANVDKETRTKRTSPPRCTVQFKRIEGWASSTPVDMRSLTSLHQINERMHKIGVNIKPFYARDYAFSDPAILPRILDNSATHEEILREFTVHSTDTFMQIVHDGEREPMYGQGEMLLATQEEGVAPYPKVYDVGECSRADKAFLVNKFGRLHFNFSQGGDRDGVDPTQSPVSVDERMILLPRPEQVDVPWFWFFYMGDGVVAKVALEPGRDVGFELSYPGIWPHGAAFFANQGRCVAQIACSRSPWHLRYDMNYAHADSTTAAYPANQNGISPDHKQVLECNPWIDFSQFVEGGEVVPSVLEV